MNTVIYHTIKLQLSNQAPLKLNYQEQHDELYLSANGVMSGSEKHAHLDSPQLCAQFIEAYMPRLQKRHGADVRAEIVEVTCNGFENRTTDRITKDSNLARRRLEKGVLAANLKP